MSLAFKGTALPLDANGMEEVVDRLRVGAAEIWAVLSVETRGCGFLPDRRPFILFERHIFSRETDRRFDSAYPDISNLQPGGYGAGGAGQYDRFQRAIALDRRAALCSASWGIGPLPDLVVRAAQIYLTYLGYRPRPVDGVPGRFTRSALNDFQTSHELPCTDEMDESVPAILRKEVDRLP